MFQIERSERISIDSIAPKLYYSSEIEQNTAKHKRSLLKDLLYELKAHRHKDGSFSSSKPVLRFIEPFLIKFTTKNSTSPQIIRSSASFENNDISKLDANKKVYGTELPPDFDPNAPPNATPYQKAEEMHLNGSAHSDEETYGPVLPSQLSEHQQKLMSDLAAARQKLNEFKKSMQSQDGPKREEWMTSAPCNNFNMLGSINLKSSGFSSRKQIQTDHSWILTPLQKEQLQILHTLEHEIERIGNLLAVPTLNVNENFSGDPLNASERRAE